MIWVVIVLAYCGIAVAVHFWREAVKGGDGNA